MVKCLLNRTFAIRKFLEKSQKKFLTGGGWMSIITVLRAANDFVRVCTLRTEYCHESYFG